MGVAVIDVNITTVKDFELRYGNTIYGSKVDYDIPPQYDDRDDTGVNARSYGLARSLGLLLDLYQPDWVMCEDNYLQHSPLTFKQLIMFVGMVTEQCRERNVYVSYVLPNLAKAIVGANFKGSEKEDVRKGVLDYKRLKPNDVAIESLDEHAIDATAVGLYGCELLAKRYGVLTHAGVSKSA
jgi:Holliday junction resolvasome RuvABC endonuclease subunit